ncbi:hypothetical protein FSP39_018693 [Pinctada imbricata]|uniref:Tyrosine-protein kinase receptor n=1 Tax=Pinctada imbricata TaxID=66713 RepID=A0AA88XS15_PINIB|nr:hypothetical protein FSP39_018693 [Pinctada imbricata]
MKNITKYKGDDVRIRCEISGNPLPQYYWYKDDIPIGKKDARMNSKNTPWGSRLKIENADVNDSGWYTCIASNVAGEVNATGFLTIKNEYPPPGKKDRDGGKSGAPDISDEDGMYKEEDRKSQESGVGFCQDFRGSTCATFLGNKTIYVTSEYSQGVKEEKFITGFTIIASTKDMTSECQKYAIKFLCLFTFPPCDGTVTDPQPVKMCRDECEMLEQKICKNEYRLGMNHPMLGSDFMPVCRELAHPDSAEGRKCFRIGVPVDKKDMNYKKEVETCYKSVGETYTGPISQTQSGKPCEYWTNNPKYPTHLFNMLGDHNKCRNPSGAPSGPWCYTDPSFLRNETCGIPKCMGAEPVNKLMYILVPGIIVPLALVILIAVVCLCQRHKASNSKEGNSVPSQLNSETLPLTGKGGGCRTKEFQLSQIRFLQELGEGAFGKVYRGEVAGIPEKVAIKTLKENAMPKVKNDFRREVDLMSELRHPNIVCLLGVCMKQEPMCMLFEHMPYGDLHEYLISHSPNSDISSEVGDSSGKKMILEYPEMLHIATQIAAGMEYLASHHFVHRDLAARNVLVGEGLSVKISDFGLSRDIYSSDYYRVQSKSLLPVRWMPPESIMYGKFTTESDIWSFGVLLWEIFSYGLQPYYGYSNQEVIEVVRARQILPNPDDCPTRIYGVMVECWHEMPGRRPPFREIHARLRQWKTEVMMQNPHWSLSQSHSAHSSSTQHSTQSGPSHHSSTGPSNTTAMTGLTGSSGGSDPTHPHGQIQVMAPPNYHELPRVHYMPNQTHMPPHQMPQYAAPQPHHMMEHPPVVNMTSQSKPQQQPLYPVINQNGPSKISPAGSIASSQKSSISSTSQDSSPNYKPGPATLPLTQTNVNNCVSNGPQLNGPSTDCQRFNSLMTQNSYIPEHRTADYHE